MCVFKKKSEDWRSLTSSLSYRTDDVISIGNKGCTLNFWQYLFLVQFFTLHWFYPSLTLYKKWVIFYQISVGPV